MMNNPNERHEKDKITTQQKHIKKDDKELSPEDLKNITGGASGASVD
jgi:hypothetical protein